MFCFAHGLMECEMHTEKMNGRNNSGSKQSETVDGCCCDLLLLYMRWVWLSHCPSQVKSSGVSVAPSYRPYLLALLTHQSNWSTLHQCISSLLNKHREQRWAALSNTLRSFCSRTSGVCNCVSSDLQTGPNLSSGLPVGLQSHSPHLAGARSENSSGLITVNITSQLWIYLPINTYSAAWQDCCFSLHMQLV